LRSYLDQGQSVVLTLGHTGNWEWAGLALGNLAPGQILCVYHALKNPHIDRFILRERSRTGLVLYPKGETVKLLKHLSGITGAMMLAADQSPANAAAAKWVTFFQVETGFAPGPELVSRKFRYPLIHMSMERVRRGHYEATFALLSGQPEQEANNALTQKYACALEKEIQDAPPNWLWSHKRWKKKETCHSEGQVGKYTIREQ
jgi:KDO2-lipid IV(A) lauroyltransferase